MHPDNTVSCINRFLGRPFKDPSVQRDLALLPLKASEAPDGGVRFHVRYGGREVPFSPAQLLAMVLSDLRRMADRQSGDGGGTGGAAVADCVLNVPAYFTQPERRAVLAAAQVAGLNCVRLLHDTTAAALAYGIYKTELPEDEPVHVAFVDMGFAATQVSVVAFTRSGLAVKGHAWDRDLGGRDLDELIFDHVAADFKARHKADVRRSPKASFKLRRQCEKVKKTLSANAEAPLNVECLMDDIDYSGAITRDQLEAWGAPWLQRLKACLAEGVARAGVPVKALTAVEVVGGGTRVPMVYRAVQEAFGQAPSRTLHAKETVCRGCALQCALLSPTYKVRPYAVVDALPYAVTGEWDDERGRPGAFSLFDRAAPLPATKSVTFHRAGPFAVTLGFVPEGGVSKAGPPATGTYTIGPFKLPRGMRAAPIRVRLGVDASGLSGVEGAAWVEEAAAAPAGRASPSPARVLAEVPVAAAPAGPGPGAGEVARLREAELKMEAADDLQEATQDAKNALESFLYSLRDRLAAGLGEGAGGKEREALSSQLSALEDWLYGAGEDQPKAVYEKKLQELKTQGAKLAAQALAAGGKAGR
ncbi:MAG: heat shock protein 70 family [Monoraphidium minutum]|nr:MAG: heat shock protein 70 family [Monoraphidium minutum]